MVVACDHKHQRIARDVEMNKYQQIEGNWVATEIIFKNNGKLLLREEYYNISFPKEVDPSWFDPSNLHNCELEVKAMYGASAPRLSFRWGATFLNLGYCHSSPRFLIAFER
jgi:hypothetical protein